MAFTIIQDRKLIRRDGSSNRYVSLNIQAPIAERETERPPVNIALVIDRSGSMNGKKIERAAEAACYVINQLKETDRFSVVAYDDEVDVIMPSTLANKDTRQDAVNRINKVHPGRTTNLFDGWMNQTVAQTQSAEILLRAYRDVLPVRSMKANYCDRRSQFN